MAKISKPRQELVYLWRQDGNDNTYPEITRAYHRLNGKFIPIGWYLDDEEGTTMLITDQQVGQVTLQDIFG